MFPYLFFSIAVSCVSPFFWCKTFFFSPFWSWSLCFHTSSSPFFLHLRLCFFCPNKFKIFCGQFFGDENVFLFFEPFRYLNIFSCVFLLAPLFFLVSPMFSDFRDSSLLLILIFCYQSSFWASSKNRFVSEKSKNHWFSSQHCSFWKTLFSFFYHFSL